MSGCPGWVDSSLPAVSRAACAYALTAATHPNDWKAAEDLFRQALRSGFRDFKHSQEDMDLVDLTGEFPLSLAGTALGRVEELRGTLSRPCSAACAVSSLPRQCPSTAG